jgi:hypothetical protein
MAGSIGRRTGPIAALALAAALLASRRQAYVSAENHVV